MSARSRWHLATARLLAEQIDVAKLGSMPRVILGFQCTRRLDAKDRLYIYA